MSRIEQIRNRLDSTAPIETPGTWYHEDVPHLIAENARLREIEAQFDMYGGDDGITALHKENTRLRAERDEMETELSQYRQAETDGLLVRLPCKVGDTVYYIGTLNYTEKAVFPTEVDDFLYPIRFRTYDFTFGDDDIGKTVFLTEQEARKALPRKGRENEL